MLKMFKYKLYPTKIQRQLMQETTFLCSLVYNHCLAQRKAAWEKEQKSISCYDQIKQLPTLKQNDSRYKKVFSQVLQETVRRLDKSFQHLIRMGKERRYPRLSTFQICTAL